MRLNQPSPFEPQTLPLAKQPDAEGHSLNGIGAAYDDVGSITSTTDARNKTITATYDNLNRLVVRNYSDTSMPDVTFFVTTARDAA